MPENMREKLIVPVEIPAWAVIVFLVSGAFGYGVLYNQLEALVKDKERVNTMYERQIRNVEAVNRHSEILRDHEQRLIRLERGQ